jgi:predicted ABC-type ATPase
MSKSNPQVIAIAGANGAGKTTIAPFILRDLFGLMEFVNADTIARGLSAYSPERVALEAGRIMFKRLRALANQRADFAFESTLSSRSFAPWIVNLQQQGYMFHLLFVWLRSDDLAVQRVRERVRMGGHEVAENVVRRRYRNGVRNFFSLYRPLAHSWGVYDNSVSGEPFCVALGGRGLGPKIFDEAVWRQFCETGK